MVESRPGRSDRDLEDFSDPVEGQIEEEAEDNHRTVVAGEPAESALELIAVDDRAHVIVRLRLARREERKLGRPVPVLPALRVAGTKENAIGPRLEAFHVAKLRKALPDPDERTLGGVLREVGIAQDPSGNDQRPSGDPLHDQGERGRVASLGPNHEFGVQASVVAARGTLDEQVVRAARLALCRRGCVHVVPSSWRSNVLADVVVTPSRCRPRRRGLIPA
jgi:hypothetical protein